MDDKTTDINGLLFPSYFQDNFFFKKYNIKTQLDLNNIINELGLHNPELKVIMYDYLINYNFENSQDFILITDEIIKLTIVDYFKYLMLHTINKKLAYSEYKRYENYNTLYMKGEKNENYETLDYLKAFNKTKKEINYYNEYLKLIKSTDWVQDIIKNVNQNKTMLSVEIKKMFGSLKKQINKN